MTGMTHEEEDVMAHINAAYAGILGLGLDYNEDELAQAIHVLQGFLKQRVLNRIYGDGWADWFNGPRSTS